MFGNLFIQSPAPGQPVYHIVCPGGVVVAAAALRALNNGRINTGQWINTGHTLLSVHNILYTVFVKQLTCTVEDKKSQYLQRAKQCA